MRLARVAVELEAGNPFDKVTDELDKMMEIIDKEQKEDEAQKAWCDSEREDHYNQLDEKQSEREQIEGHITQLTEDRDELKSQLADENAKLAQNRKDQADEIEDRGLENVAYQKNVKNLADAEATVKTA